MNKNKLIIGSMKLNKYFSTSDQLSKFLKTLHKENIRQIHVSREYKSYKLLLKSLNKIKNKNFKFIIKLAEPKNEKSTFSLKRFSNKIENYRKDLGQKNIQSIQWVFRKNISNKKIFY